MSIMEPRVFEVEGMKITYLGHASFIIELGEKRIAIDPYRISEAVGEMDIILITHDHFDHCDVPSIRKLSSQKTTIICPERCYSQLSQISKDTRIVDPLSGSWIFDDIKISPFWAYNINKPFHKKGAGVGYIVEWNGKRVYHAGDTDLIPEMKELKDITVAMIPIGGTYTMDIDQAVEFVREVRPKYVIPMHYNTFPEIKADPEEFKERVKDIAIVLI